MRREKFGTYKKQGPTQNTMAAGQPQHADPQSMKLPGIRPHKDSATYGGKSGAADNSSLTVQRQHSLVNQTSLNYPTGEPLTAVPKGMTPKRRQNLLKQSAAKPKENESQTSMSQLSPKTAAGMYHQSHSHTKNSVYLDSSLKNGPPGST